MEKQLILKTARILSGKSSVKHEYEWWTEPKPYIIARTPDREPTAAESTILKKLGQAWPEVGTNGHERVRDIE